MSLLAPSRFADLLSGIESETKPATHLERWLADELAYANWEIERARINMACEHAE